MINTDLSDEAAIRYFLDAYGKMPIEQEIRMWRECRRRAELKIEEERCKAFEAGYLMRKKLPPLTPGEAYLASKEMLK